MRFFLCFFFTKLPMLKINNKKKLTPLILTINKNAAQQRLE